MLTNNSTNSLLDTFQNLDWESIFNRTKDSPKALPEILTLSGVTSDYLAQFAKLPNNDAEPYGREVLFKNNNIEVMVALWGMRSVSCPHNHGASKGLIWFAKGQFFEQSYSLVQNNLFVNGPAVNYFENTVVTVEPTDIHSCGPKGVGLSLHIYSPPINEMKVWDIKNRKTLTVANECGAWIPQDSGLILSETSW